MDQSLTIVLPVHNVERTIRRDVIRVLDAAVELTSRVELLLLDDCSSDYTIEIAHELAMEYRQISVASRQRNASLTDSLRAIRNQIEADVVIVHDGSSVINAEQLRLIWNQQRALGAMREANRGVSFADLRRPGQTHPQMVEAHRRLFGFQRMGNQQPSAAEPAAMADNANQRTDSAADPATKKRRGMGAIPSLPKQNLFGALSDFALGE